MKKFNLVLTALLFSFLLVFSTLSPVYANENTEEISTEEAETDNNENTVFFDENRFGDIDSDGLRSASDARILLRCSVSLEETTDTILMYGDYNSDKIITADDARTALRVSVDLESIRCILHGHNIASYKISETCTTNGYTTNKCSDCTYTDGSQTDIIPAAGHSLITEETKATCTSDGITTTFCEKCKHINNKEVTERAHGHSFSVWVISGNTKSKTCRNCGHIETSDKIKTVYLTFDDGPGPYTEKLLGYLREYNVKATFFVTNQMPRYKYLLKEIAKDGHAIGVHTLTHQWSIYSSTDSYLRDFNAMHQIIKDETGIDTEIFRFPGGTNNTVSRSYCRGIMTSLSKTMTDRGFRYYDWNVDCCDTLGYNSSRIAQTTINQIKSRNTSIVLMHDIKNSTVEAIKSIIRYGLDNGYEFAVIDESTPVIRFSPAN